MKKVFLLLAAASFMFMACEQKNNPDNKPDDGKEQEKPAEYEAPINIDGDFSDWAKLDASKVATATCDPNATKTALKTVKVYADAVNIFAYVEFEVGEIEADAWIPFHFYLNADNSDATGGDSQQFADKDAEWLLETSITNYDCALFKWWGEVGGDGWNWTDPSVEHTADDGWGAIIPEGSGIGLSAGSYNPSNGKGTYEIQIIRDMLSGVEFADTFTVGFDIQVDWSTVGMLPNKAEGELAPKLKVNVVK